MSISSSALTKALIHLSFDSISLMIPLWVRVVHSWATVSSYYMTSSSRPVAWTACYGWARRLEVHVPNTLNHTTGRASHYAVRLHPQVSALFFPVRKVEAGSQWLPSPMLHNSLTLVYRIQVIGHSYISQMEWPRIVPHEMYLSAVCLLQFGKWTTTTGLWAAAVVLKFN